jgi:DNA repair protein RadA/Sms
MSKTRCAVRCQECGYLSPKWMGRCPNCGEWNTMVEESIKGETGSAGGSSRAAAKPQRITEVVTKESDRLSTQIPEFDRVLGGGIVAGSLILLGGQPGIGKSTILLQVAFNIAQAGHTVLLVSGEESPHQLRMRANRLRAVHDNLLILAETDIEQIQSSVEQSNPSLLVIDSIQTVFHSDVSAPPGSVSQLRECTNFICQFAKTKNIPVFIVGHVTKEGSIAGPRVLEHMVDSVLYFETSSNQSSRIIRSVKNRFGSTNEIAVFEMQAAGLAEVDNPSALFLAQRSASVSGSVVVALAEGSRSLLVELQALIVPSYLTNPRRFTSGMDYNRLSVIIAVLEKRGGLRLENKDIYLNAVGGVKISEPAADLGAALAIASSCQDIKIDQDLVAIGEIGLGGEVRPISFMEERIKEATKLGFNKVMLPYSEQTCPAGIPSSTIIGVKTINDALDYLR